MLQLSFGKCALDLVAVPKFKKCLVLICIKAWSRNEIGCRIVEIMFIKYKAYVQKFGVGSSVERACVRASVCEGRLVCGRGPRLAVLFVDTLCIFE